MTDKVKGAGSPGAMDDRAVRVFEWPLRVWHWLLAATLSGSLITGLSGDIGWMDWHLRFGFVVCGLLLFRLAWGFVGGRYSRWRSYRTSPGGILDYFRGATSPDLSDDDTRPSDDARLAHTPPGVALIAVLLLGVFVQALSGLFSTDEIFIEGPLVRHAEDEVVAAFTAIHHRAFYVVLAAVGVHLLAHLVYGLRRDPLPLSMFTGRKRLPRVMPDTSVFGIRALAIGVASAAAVWLALDML